VTTEEQLAADVKTLGEPVKRLMMLLIDKHHRGILSGVYEEVDKMTTERDALRDEADKLRTIVRSITRIISQNEPYKWKVERIVAALEETS
jgi:uncharacterized coiled-coil DUF342 family protein